MATGATPSFSGDAKGGTAADSAAVTVSGPSFNFSGATINSPTPWAGSPAATPTMMALPSSIPMWAWIGGGVLLLGGLLFAIFRRKGD